MQVLIINKDLDSERWHFQQAQCRRLGLSFERVPAVHFESLLPDRNDKFWLTWERHLMDAEKSAFCSHRNAWQKVLEVGANTLILEDDAVLSNHVSSFLRKFEDDNSFDHITLETRGRLKLVGKRIKSGICRLYLDRCGAAAYILSPEGASKLLDQYMNKAALADAAIALACNLKSYQAYPAMAFQLDQCDCHRISFPVKTVSSISPSAQKIKDLGVPNYNQRLKRLIHQVRIFWRNISRLRTAQRILVPIDRDHFNPTQTI
jgi:glycosyl transferase, family 25